MPMAAWTGMTMEKESKTLPLPTDACIPSKNPKFHSICQTAKH